MAPQSLLVVVLCVHAASAAFLNGSSGKGPRTFSYGSSPTVEILDLDSILSENQNGSGGWNKTTNENLSKDTRLFLTGPVSTLLIPSFYTLVCLISFPINFCAVLAFAKKIRPMKPAAIYMLNLACADLLFTVLLPFKIYYYFVGNNWTFGPFMCRVVTAAFYWNMYCSVLLISCISVDRLIAVVYPIPSLTWRRPQYAVIACVTIWILSFTGSVPLLLSNQSLYITELNITTCHDVQMLDDLNWKYKIYFITICCALFFLPLLISVVSYTRVIWSLRKVSRGIPGSTRKKTRAVVMAVTVLVIFVLCFMPTNCIMLVHYLQFGDMVNSSNQAPDSSYALYLFFLCLGSVNCCLDPMVYYFGSSQCQRQLTSVMRCEKTSYTSSRNTILKSTTTESCKISSSSEMDSFQANLNSQYKKLLV